MYNLWYIIDRYMSKPLVVFLTICSIVALGLYIFNLLRLIYAREAIMSYVESILNNRRSIIEVLLNKISQSRSNILNEALYSCRYSAISILNDARILKNNIQSYQVVSSELRKDVDNILHGAENKSRYFRNISEVVKYSEGKLMCDILESDLKHFMNTLIVAYRFKYSLIKEITLEYSAPVLVYFDPFKMEQLFDNLFARILKHNIELDIVINIQKTSINFVNQVLDAVLISVKVNDSKLSEDDLKIDGSKMIFDIIGEFHNAKIWVGSREGYYVHDHSRATRQSEIYSKVENKDFIFNILIPLVGQMQGKQMIPFTSVAFESLMLSRLQKEDISFNRLLEEYRLICEYSKKIAKNMHILFIDENPAMSDYAKITLSDIGFDVDIYQSFKEIIVTISDNIKKYDMIIMDIFSEEYGNEIIHLIYKICKKNNIPIIFHMGYINNTHRKIFESENTYLILKPYSLKEMRNIMLDIMRRRQIL